MILKHGSENQNRNRYYTCFWMNLRTGECVWYDDNILLHISSFPLWDNKCVRKEQMLDVNSGYVLNLVRLFVYVNAEYKKSEQVKEEVYPMINNKVSSKAPVHKTAEIGHINLM